MFIGFRVEGCFKRGHLDLRWQDELVNWITSLILHLPGSPGHKTVPESNALGYWGFFPFKFSEAPLSSDRQRSLYLSMALRHMPEDSVAKA